MLTLDDIVSIYDAGFDIDIDDEADDSLVFGHCLFKDRQVIAYVSNIGLSLDELYKTIIHEFIHARDYLLGTIKDEFIGCKDEESTQRFIEYEKRVEQETELTYRNHPEIGKIIFECWGLTQYTNKAA